MATSGTFAFNPTAGDLMIAAYGRCGIRRTALTAEHLQDGQIASNLLQVEWANEQVNLWTVDLQSIPLVQGTATYNVLPSTIMIMAAYVSITVGGVTTDRIVTSIDRDTYAAFPNKASQSRPTVYWFNQQLVPTITLWQVPDANGPYTLNFYRAHQQQDVVIASGLNADIPYAFTSAYVAGLAYQVSMTWAPDRTEKLYKIAQLTFDAAKKRNVENAPMRIVPALGSYTDSVF